MGTSKEQRTRAPPPPLGRGAAINISTWDRRRVDGGAVQPGTVHETQVRVHCNGYRAWRTAGLNKNVMPRHREKECLSAAPSVWLAQFLGLVQFRLFLGNADLQRPSLPSD